MKCLICTKRIYGRRTVEVRVKSYNSKRKWFNTVLHPICFKCIENLNFRNPSNPSDNNDFKKDFSKCDSCGWEKRIEFTDEYGKGYCKDCMKNPVPKS